MEVCKKIHVNWYLFFPYLLYIKLEYLSYSEGYIVAIAQQSNI